MMEDLDDVDEVGAASYGAYAEPEPEDDDDILVIDGVESDDDYNDNIPGGNDNAAGGYDAAAGANGFAQGEASTSGGGAPRVLKPWPLPPSLTPKKRSRATQIAEVALDLEARPGADGVWRCATCQAGYTERVGLFAHARFCVGRAESWSCDWCGCNESATNHKASGPNGQKTLCSACGQRYRHGATEMPLQNDKGEWVCNACQRAFPTMSALGGHRRFCDGGCARPRPL